MNKPLKLRILQFVKRLFCKHEYSTLVEGSYFHNPKNSVVIQNCINCGHLRENFASDYYPHLYNKISKKGCKERIFPYDENASREEIEEIKGAIEKMPNDEEVNIPNTASSRMRQAVIDHLRSMADGLQSHEIELESCTIEDETIWNYPLLGTPTPDDKRRVSIMVIAKR